MVKVVGREREIKHTFRKTKTKNKRKQRNLSSGFVLSSKSNMYWNPEHPPVSTLNRSILWSDDCSLACNSFILCKPCLISVRKRKTNVDFLRSWEDICHQPLKNKTCKGFHTNFNVMEKKVLAYCVYNAS